MSGYSTRMPGAGDGDRLPPFSGDVATCPKCGLRGETSARYFPSGLVLGVQRVHADGEHLARECKRCGYGWDEAVKEPQQ